MATTFHNFLALPPELRLQIWKNALRPSTPGVHFFSLQERSVIPQALSRPAPASLHVGMKYVMASPSFTNGPPRLWREDNPSTHLIDAGLWAAQRESREVVRMNTASGLKSASQLATEPAQEDWARGVLPHQDLICLQVALHKPMAVDKALFDLRHIIRNPDIKPGTSAPVHIAFEYNTSWAFGNRGRMGDLERRQGSRRCFMDVFSRVRSGRLTAKLYLIDHQAKLRPGANAPLLFRANGYEFVHVDRTQVQDGRRSEPTSVWNFLDIFDTKVLRYWAPLELWEPGPPTLPRPFSTQKYVRVLACQKR